MKDAMNLRQQIGIQANRNRKFTDKFEMKGHYPLIQHLRNGKVINEFSIENGIVDQGKNYILNAGFNEGSQEGNWAIGLISNSGFSGLNATDLMSSHSTWSEFTSYTEAERPAWGQGTAVAKSVSNSTAALFSINGNGTLKGIFVASDNTKNGNTGILWAHGLFPADVPVADGDQIRITYAVAT